MVKFFVFLWGLALLPHWAAASDLSSCKALGDGNAYGDEFSDYRVLFEGKDGYIFRSRQDLRANFEMEESSLEIYKKFSRDLKKNGTELVLVIPPIRGVTAQSLLPGDNPITQGFDPKAAARNYAEFISKMNKSGISVAGTPEVKTGVNYYYKTDLHWSTAGASEMAEAVAKTVKNMGAYRSIKKMEFITSPLKDITYEGRFTEAISALCHIKIPEEKDSLTQTVRANVSEDKDALFADQPFPDIALVGTSYSKRENNDMNFEGALKQFLSADVYNAAIAGGGVDDSLIAYLNSKEYKEHPPKVLIWEIPGYYDLNGESAIKTILQALPAVHGDCKNPLAEGRGIKLDSKSVTLMDNLQAKKISSTQSYLFLNFADPVKKNFSVSFVNEDQSKETLKFKRSKRYPYDGKFFFAPYKKHDSFLKSITASIPVEMQGANVDVKLCPLQ